MQWIADNLFVGNKLTSSKIRTSDGDPRLDLRNVRSPIVVLYSWGDNITPPQQALDWILDLYEKDDDSASRTAKTIVYTLHKAMKPSRHLRLEAGSREAHEHAENASCMEMINLLPPGALRGGDHRYDDGTANPPAGHGKHLFRWKPASSTTFAHSAPTAPRTSALRHGGARPRRSTGPHRAFLQPAVQAATTEQSADRLREAHPNRLRFAALGPQPCCLADPVAGDCRPRRPPAGRRRRIRCAPGKSSLDLDLGCWQNYQTVRDATTEAMFLATYGSPLLQAMAGIDAQDWPKSATRDLTRDTVIAERRAELEEQFEAGGVGAAVIRAIAYLRMDQGHHRRARLLRHAGGRA